MPVPAWEGRQSRHRWTKNVDNFLLKTSAYTRKYRPPHSLSLCGNPHNNFLPHPDPGHGMLTQKPCNALGEGKCSFFGNQRPVSVQVCH